MFTRFKTIGKNVYAYEVRSFWDAKAQATRQETRYLGKVLDKKRKKYEKTLYKRNQEKAILDFGDVYALSSIYRRSGLEKIVQTAFPTHANTIDVLLFNKVLHPLPMKSVYYWASETYLSRTHELSELETQKISSALSEIGEEKNLRVFFETYIRSSKISDSNLFDITSLPTSLSCPLSGWGYSDSGIDFQVKLALLVDRTFQKPLYFRLLPGSLADITTLVTTLKEAEKMGLNPNLLILDRGFFSKKNLTELQSRKVRFILPVPIRNKIFKKFTTKHLKKIEKPTNAFRLNGRILFGVKDKIRNLHAYVLLDPERKLKEAKQTYSEYLDEEINQAKLENELEKKGIMILLSTENLPVQDALSLYYSRDFVEKCFKYSKTDLSLLPLRRHNEATLRGYLLINFLALALYLNLKKNILKISLEEAFLILRGMKKKIFENDELTTEPTKKQKDILKALNILMPK